MRYFLKLSFLLFISTSSFAQTRQVYFDNISVEQGLPNGRFFKIVQDSKGYIWICGFEGLFKYNGEKITPEDRGTNNTRLTTTRVYDIGEDSKGDLWVATLKGLNKIDGKTGEIQQHIKDNTGERIHLNGLIYRLFVSSNDEIWISTGEGISKYNPTHKSHKSKEDTIAFTYHFYEDVDKNIWLATSNGLVMIDPTTLDTKYKIDSFNNVQLGKVSYIYEDSQHTIWVGTKSGLLILDLKQKRLKPAKLLPKKYSRKHFWRIIEDRNHNYWFSIVDKLLCLEKETGKVVEYDILETNTASLKIDKILDLFKDNNGNIWIGTNIGINKINTDVKAFKFYKLFPEHGDYHLKNYVQRIHQRTDNSFIYYSYEKLYYSKSIGTRPIEIQNAPPHFMENMHEMPNGETWGCYSSPAKGVWKYEPSTNSMVKLKLSDDLDTLNVFQLETDIDTSEIFWLATERGFYKYDLRKEDIHKRLLKVGEPIEVRKLHQSKRGKLWGTAGNMLVSYHKKTGKYERILRDTSELSIVESKVRDISEAVDGKVWVAYESGLSCYDDSLKTFKTYTTKNGIKGSNIIYSVLCDNRNRVWFTTFNHIISFDSKTKTFQYFSQVDGINTSFNRRCAYKLKNGQFAFGGANGLVLFHPDSINYSRNNPRLVINSIMVNNEPYNSDILPECQSKIQISYSDNILSFGYKALEYYTPGKNHYRYKMEGYDKEWVHVDNIQRATYSNLPPGEYEFKVTSTNYNGAWNNKEAVIKVIVTPLFWQQIWFKLLILSVIGLAIYYLWKINIEKKRLKQQKEVAEQNDRYKTLFLGNISHEIRTPLNAIIGLNTLLLDTTLNNKQHKYVRAASLSSESLLTLINDLLDQAKIESGKFHFTKKDFNIRNTVQQVTEIFRHKADVKYIYLNTAIDNNVPDVVIGDTVRLHQILSNLVSNAIKFTHKGGIDIVVLSKLPEGNKALIQFEVKDTGIGIEKEKLNTIFESFHQIPNDTTDTNIGTGLGLSICKQLIEQQGGIISVNSEPNRGSSFIFQLTFDISNKDLKKTEISISKKELPENLRVLLVEDTPFNQLLTLEILKKNMQGVSVTVAENGLDALNIIKESKDFDVVLMDVKMPVLNGYDTTKAIRSLDNPYYKHLPIIAITANVVPEQLKMCKNAGMNMWVTKPIDAQLLLDRITTSLKQKRNDKSR